MVSGLNRAPFVAVSPANSGAVLHTMTLSDIRSNSQTLWNLHTWLFAMTTPQKRNAMCQKLLGENRTAAGHQNCSPPASSCSMAPMDTKQILASLRAERDRLNNAIAAIESLDGTGITQARGAANTLRRRRSRISAAGRKRLSDLLKKRWAQGKMGRAKATKK